MAQLPSPETTMLATTQLPLSAPRLHSAGDLCKLMLAAGAHPGRFDATDLNRTLRHDAERGLLEVQAGVGWRCLEPHVGAAFLPGSVGESVAANCAGPDGEPIVRHLHALTLVTAAGELHRASREHAPALFRLAVGGCGAFGPFYSLTLDLPSLARSAARSAAPARIGLPDDDPGGPRIELELLVPPQRSDEVVAQVRAALAEHRCRLCLLEARRILPENETCLRWARSEFVALRIAYRTRATLGACASAAQLRGRLIDLAIGAGGSFMPRLLPLATRAQAAACYPMLAVFLAEKRRLDPAERVPCPWYRGVRRAWRPEACTVRWARD
jgi:FAD/FMN-containing dehydrogenase